MQSFAVEVFFHQYWTDLRLRTPAGLEPKTKIRLNKSWKEKLWTPDTYFRNAIDGSVSNIIDPIFYFTIKNQTKVFMAIKLTLEFSCDMNFEKYPFDTQKCSFEVSSRKWFLIWFSMIQFKSNSVLIYFTPNLFLETKYRWTQQKSIVSWETNTSFYPKGYK